MLVLTDLFFSLGDLLLLKVCQLSEIASELFQFMIGLHSVLFIPTIAIRAVMAQGDRLLNDLFKGRLKDALGDAITACRFALRCGGFIILIILTVSSYS